MAHFIGYVAGGRGTASRVGHKTTGLTANINGWNSGVRVEAKFDKELCVDRFEIYATTGSGYGDAEGLIGYVVDGVFTKV